MLTKSTTIKSFILNRDKVMSSRKTAVLFVAMVAATLIGRPLIGEGYNFDIVRPIIYQSTDRFINMGVAEYTIDYTYSNPCDILKSYLSQPNQPVSSASSHLSSINNTLQPMHSYGTQLQTYHDDNCVNLFITECNALYDKTWIFKITELLSRTPTVLLLPNHHHKRSIREKRGFITNIIFGTCISNFLSALYETVVPWSNYHLIKDLQAQQAEEAAKILKFQHQFNMTHAINAGFLDLVRNNTRSIREQQKQMNYFLTLSNHLTWLSSLIQTRITLSSIDLRTIIDEYAIHRRVATAEMPDLLNITELKSIENIDTEFISVHQIAPNTLRLKFNVGIKSQDTAVYQVHAFRYWDNLTHTPTLMEYQGDKFVIYNSTANCIKGIEEPTSRAVDDYCDTANFSSSNLNTWRSLLVTKDIYGQHKTAAIKKSLSYN